MKSHHSPRINASRPITMSVIALCAALLGACGGGSDEQHEAAGSAGSAPNTTGARAFKAAVAGTPLTIEDAVAGTPLTTEDAVRLAHQATFGPTEPLLAEMRTQGAEGWIQAQQALRVSRYSLGQGDALHRHTAGGDFCSAAAFAGPNCWRDWYSTQPLVWDFYRNATRQPDQLRQRVAFALQQIVVVNNLDVQGTYGFRAYHNTLLELAFGNYRDVLRKVAMSPVMGDFLNNVNNDKAAPNENFARELLQLFAIGTCELQPDGTLAGGTCQPTYDNEIVRNYAHALTGWTYPAGGATAWGCLPQGANCRHYGGDMVPIASLHDTSERKLLSRVTLPQGSSAPAALEQVIESLMRHSNIAPFIGRQLIQHLVSSNPTPAYVARVGAAFRTGLFTSRGVRFGNGQPGDLAATVAAVLLDTEARGGGAALNSAGGKLREPVLYFTGVLRALGGQTDGEALGAWWGEALRQHVFRPPSVFSFYAMDYPLVESPHVAPSFGIHNAGSALDRLNFLAFLLQWGGAQPRADVPGATGTMAGTTAFENDAADAGVLVDRLAKLATGTVLPAGPRQLVVQAVETIGTSGNPQWRSHRVRQAAYLVFASPQYHVYR